MIIAMPTRVKTIAKMLFPTLYSWIVKSPIKPTNNDHNVPIAEIIDIIIASSPVKNLDKGIINTKDSTYGIIEYTIV